MTFRNRQMRIENMLNGVRGCMVWKPYNEVFVGITWDNMYARLCSGMEYGWTKYSDDYLIAHFINAHFLTTRAVDNIGYSTSASIGSAVTNLTNRLRRMNVMSFLEIHDAMVINGLIDKHHLKGVIERNIQGTTIRRTNARVYRGDIFRFFTKSIITDAMAKAHSRKNSKHTKAQNVAIKFGTTEEHIKYWIKQKVVDIRVQSMD